VTPWIIAAICCAGGGFIAWGSAHLRLRWPLAILSLLLAAISIQLLLAAQGREGFHDLAALVAQTFTVLPALVGVLTGLVLARLGRQRMAWRGIAGAVAGLGLLVAAVGVAATLLL